MADLIFKDMRFTSPYGEIIVRPFSPKDIEAQVAYLCDSPKDFLTSTGFDINKLPEREAYTSKLKKMLEADVIEKTFFSVVAELNGKTIAAVHYHQKTAPEVDKGHFHIFDPNLRGKGLGGPILKAALKLLFAQHGLKQLHIEPKFDNLPMNRLMEKCGFKFLEVTTYTGPITTTFKANRYEVVADMLNF